MARPVTYKTTNRAYRSRTRLKPAGPTTAPSYAPGAPSGGFYSPNNGPMQPGAPANKNYAPKLHKMYRFSKLISARMLVRLLGTAGVTGILGYQFYQWMQQPGVVIEPGEITVGQEIGDWTVISTQAPGSGYVEYDRPEWDYYSYSLSPTNRNRNFGSSQEAAMNSWADAEDAVGFELGDNTAWWQKAYQAPGYFKWRVHTLAILTGGAGTIDFTSPTRWWPLGSPGTTEEDPGPVPGTWNPPKTAPYGPPNYDPGYPAPPPNFYPGPGPNRNPNTNPNPGNNPGPNRNTPPGTSFGWDVGPNGDTTPTPTKNTKGRPGSKTKETKVKAGTALFSMLALVNRLLGEGLELIEIIAGGYGFEGFQRDGTGRNKTQQALDHIANASSEDWDWNNFFDEIVKKHLEDKIGGAAFKNINDSARNLGIEVPYSITGI